MWLIYALTSYLCTATTSVADKILLNKIVSHPFVYAFTIAMLGCVVVFAIPFGVTVIPLTYLLWSLLSGGLFVGALLVLFTAYKLYPVSVAATIVGGAQPIATLVLANIFLGESLSISALIAVIVLIISIGFLSYSPKQKIEIKLLELTSLSGFLFASSFVIGKFIYEHVSFLDGIFWSRIGAGVCALALLGVASYRQAVLQTKQQSPQAPLLVIVIQAIGALGFILFNMAIATGSVTVVNALLGVQFALIFVLSSLLSSKFVALKENITPKILTIRLIGLGLVALGLYILA
ncbi:EamA family transporter [Candidatus Falkowbacteria bacterium]|nr:EamA family transporter [Candidatus Falkowbacteria bacterium]